MAITQLSLFLMNQPGQLVDAVGALSDGGANLRAMSIAESNDFGILRIIVSDPDKACELLKDKFQVADMFPRTCLRGYIPGGFLRLTF